MYSRKRGIRKKSQIQNASGEAVYKAEFPRYVRYADTYIYEVRVCPATSAYRLKDIVYTFTLSTYAGFLTYTANFVIILRLELPRAMDAGRNTGTGASLAVDYARLLYEIAGELHRFAQNFLMSRIIRCTLNSRAQ